jgi:hypothetical protein
MRRRGMHGKVTAMIAAIAILCPLLAARSKPEKTQVVDSGTFAVLVNGEQMATETFRIEQGAGLSTLTSEFKSESGPKAVQKAELQVTSAGDLRRYTWHELSPEKAQIVVEPSDQFVIEHITPAPPEHPVEQPLFLPLSTMILDDYFFSQREVLLWRYLAQSCPNGQLQGCQLPRTQFGILSPQQHAPLVVTLEYAGTETVKSGDTERKLSRFNLQTEQDPPWALYVDSDLKLVRIVIPSEKTEVVRK